MTLWTILTKCPGAVRPAVQVALVRTAATGRAARRRRCCTGTGREGCEQRREPLHHGVFAADHLAVAALGPGDAAARAHVEMVDSARLQRGGAADVIAVVGVAAVDDDVVGVEQRRERGQHLIDEGRRNHQPDRTRSHQRGDQLLQRGRAGGALRRQPIDGGRLHVVDDAGVITAHQPAHHVGPHASESDHTDLHFLAPLQSRSPAATRCTTVPRRLFHDLRAKRLFGNHRWSMPIDRLSLTGDEMLPDATPRRAHAAWASCAVSLDLRRHWGRCGVASSGTAHSRNVATDSSVVHLLRPLAAVPQRQVTPVPPRSPPPATRNQAPQRRRV